MKKMLVAIALVLVISLGNTRMFSLQDESAEAKARQEAAAAAAETARINEAKDAANDKARDNFINNLRNQSNANLAAAESKAREAKRKENETKFAALQQSAKELMESARKPTNK